MVTPRILHRIFLDDPIPEEFETYWRMFQVLHPRWDFMTWNDSSKLGWIKNREAFDRATTHAGRSDVLRYELLAEIGGVYVDTDVEPLKEFDPLLDERPFAGWEDHNLLCPTVMGSPPHHPAIDKLIHELPVWSRMHANSPPNRQTGPYFLTKMWKKRNDVNRLPTEAFYPIHWSKKRDLGGPYPEESYAVHHWAAQWLPDGPPQR
jgi:mannosyltransferase OCH1-like enzyme